MGSSRSRDTRTHMEKAEALLDKLNDVHPSMVKAYLEEAHVEAILAVAETTKAQTDNASQSG
jgi:hypothetical protein